MKRKVKVTITSMAVLLVMALATTIISFSLANNNGEGNLVTEEELVAVAASSDKTTNIDYIIKNSHSTDPDIDTVYHIVEIGSSATPSTFKAFSETAAGKTAFEQYVLNGNKSASLAEDMAEGKIDYTYYVASTITDDDTAKLQKISQADFIYVSNDTNTPYAVGNDLCEKLYNLLHTYAVGDYKPLVIDSPTKSGNTPSADSTTKFSDLIKNYYAASGTRYFTYGWDPSSVEASTFFSTTLGTSRYIGINSLNASSNWVNLVKADTSTAKMANILTITVNNDCTLTDKVLTGCIDASSEVLTLNGTTVTPADKVYNLSPSGVDSAFKTGGYSSRYSYRPDYAKVTTVNLENTGNGYKLPDNTPDFSTFDLIIVEKACSDSTVDKITIDSFQKLTAAMYADYHIIYDARIAAAAGGPTGGDINAEENNYKELFYMVANEEEIARYANIMVTDREEISIITSSNSAATCKVIADLINASSWRGIGGPGQSSNSFTVLEIQPCYPINNQVAAAKGNTYYTRPSEMINNMTAEELGINLDNVTSDASEFYDWEVSPAKIAEALNMDVSNITVKHMSTEELKASKQTFLGNYDLIYIGGNTSAFKSVYNQRSITQIGKNANYDLDISSSVQDLRYLPTYRMYSHNGDLINLDFELLGSAGWKATTGNKANIVGNAVVNGSSVETFTMANGNDISYNNLTALQDYVNAGMPVIVSHDAAAAYDLIATDIANGDNPYLQNSIDPDCNMYKLLATCKTKAGTTACWDFSTATVKADNDGGRLGNTSTGYVQVFDDSAAIKTLYGSSTHRLSLALTKRPAEYNSYDATTKLSSSTLDFAFDVGGSNTCTIEFYIDEDGNGNFSADEKRDSKSCSGSDNKVSGTFSFALDDYDGPVYWMVKATSGKMAACSTGVAFIKPDEGERTQVNVLQIVPKNTGDNKYDGAQGINSLYFCTECQKTLNVLDYNPVSQGHYDADSTIYASSDGGSAWTQPTNGVYTWTEEKYWPVRETIVHELVFGQHEHTFGIPRYVDTYVQKNSDGDDATGSDVIVGRDDWSDNLADELSDYYTFNLEIMTTAEYDAYSASIETAYNNLKSTNATDEELRTASGEALTNAETAYNAYIKGLDSIEKAIKESTSGENLAATYDVIASTDGELTVKEKTLRNVIRDMIKAAGNDTIRTAIGIGSNQILLKDELIKRLQERDYYNFYGLAGFTNNTSTYLNLSYGVTVKYCTQEQKDLGGFNYYFSEYSTAVDKKLELKKAYMDASCLNSYIVNFDEETGYSDWLSGSYDSVIVGPAENFNNDDIAAGVGTETMRSFANNGGTVLLFHETLGRYTDVGPKNLTSALLDAAGSSSNFEPDTSMATGVPYLPYKVKDSVIDADENAKDKYFLTNLSYKLKGESTTYTNWVEDMKAGYSGFSTPTYYFAPNLYSNNQFYENGRSSGTGYGSNPYKYGIYNWGKAAAWATSAGSGGSSKAGTDKATQNNKGLITSYPFTLSDRLNITGTHSSAFSVDLERDGLTVWYSLAGGTSTIQGNSEIFAASPNDGEDSYFIYSNKNVFYCGAGHTKVTGQLKNNNDERRLYINIICNSVRKSTLQPGIKVYDYNSNPLLNKEIVETDDGYLYEIPEEKEYPYFTFKTITDEGDSLQEVSIYYKVDASTSYKDFTTDVDKMIAHWSTENGGKIPFKAGDVVNIGSAFDATLKLDDSYFEQYGGNYTYIVIAIKTKNAETGAVKTVYQKIKIVRMPHLFDLT